MNIQQAPNAMNLQRPWNDAGAMDVPLPGF
jgi:hypothetical protein